MFASAGGIKFVAKYFHENNTVPLINYEGNDQQMTIQLQNQLISKGLPQNLLHLLNLFEADSIGLCLQQFGATNDSEGLDNFQQLELRKDLVLSDFDKLDIDFNSTWFEKDKKNGFIRFLKDLPRLPDDNIDIGMCNIYLRHLI